MREPWMHPAENDRPAEVRMPHGTAAFAVLLIAALGWAVLLLIFT